METLAGELSVDEGEVTVVVGWGPWYTYLASSPSLVQIYSAAGTGQGWGPRVADAYVEPPLCHSPFWTELFPWW